MAVHIAGTHKAEYFDLSSFSYRAGVTILAAGQSGLEVYAAHSEMQERIEVTGLVW